jgi:hypothetical protein
MMYLALGLVALGLYGLWRERRRAAERSDRDRG